MSEVHTRIDVNRDGLMVVERLQDVEPILKQAKALADNSSGKSESGDMYHAARLPMVIVEQYCNSNHITFHEWMSNPEHLRRMLSDPALSRFRIWNGRV